MTSVFYHLIRFALGGLFLYTGFAKLMTPIAFATLIDAYGLIPSIATFPIAITLALLEIFAGMGMITDFKGSLSLVTGLLVFFMMVLGYGIWMGLEIDCGCFGSEDPELAAFHGLRTAFIRDLLFLVGALFLFHYRRRYDVTPKSWRLSTFHKPYHKGEPKNEAS